eukprot:TRINITY_DN28126_c0_g1_i1.p1 TRINITY_DN28126_c0_g1~~TRINITY_DN28126_c0_g1_i1.p1  ORF type:complete len:341 (+),score=83.46 TRINITY_DN28126_c0_g1_i1:254-1276(+)
MSALDKYTVGDAIDKNQKVVVIYSDEKLDAVFNKLAQQLITSAPVLDRKTLAVLGFVDMLDLLAALVDASDTPILVGEGMAARKVDHVEDDDLNSQRLRNAKLLDVEAAKLVNRSGRNPCEPIPTTHTLRAAAALFSKGVHRVPVTDATGSVINIFTQSRFLDFLKDHPELLEPILDERCLDADVGTLQKTPHNVHAVKPDTTVIDAFRIMNKNALSAIAITDEEGKLLSQLSASDLRGLDPYGVPGAGLNILVYLELPVMDFLKQVRKDEHLPSDFLVWSTANSTVGRIIEHMSNTNVHRVYLISEYTHLLGVVSITDIARILHKLPAGGEADVQALDA